MTIPDINTPGVPQATATVFVWLADKVLGGAKKALGWGWERAQWAAAQDRYDEQIIKQYGWIRIFGQTTPKPLKEIFTDVYMLDKATALRRFDPNMLRNHPWAQDRGMPFRYDERLQAEQLLKRGDKFFILGKPGAGKTTFLKHLAVREAQRGKWGSCLGKIPIFVPLKQFAESSKTIFDFIVEHFAVCHFPDAARFVELLLKDGKALVLFDGLDEVTKDATARTDRRGQVTEQIEQFSRQYDGCHIAITCRIAATEHTFGPAFIYLELADFAPDQVDAFVRNWFWDDAAAEKGVLLAEKMLAEWERSEHAGIRDLGRNPLLLTLLCLNYAEARSFPARRVEIYQEALDALLKKWDSSRQIQRGGLYKTLSLGRKQQMFSRIAYDGFIQDEILFPQADLEGRLKAYLAHVPEMPDAIDIDAEAVLREIIEQHGIFVEQSRGLFSFAHLTFQEYYAARYLAENPAPDVLEPLLTRMADDKWREVFLLTASLLADATSFLVTLEQALYRLIAHRPQLVALLRWIDEQAATSQTGYQRRATRFWYARALVRASIHSLTLAISLDLDIGRDRDLDHGLDLAHDLARDRDLAREITCERDSTRVAQITEALNRVRESLRQASEMAQVESLSTLVVPPAEADQALWDQFAGQLDKAIAASAVFRRYQLLATEIDALLKTSNKRWRLDEEDLEAFVEYARATRIFYDCLQLAYTPDRRAFEDRIFLPSPLTDQEA